MALLFSPLVSSNPRLGKGSSPHAGGLRRAPGSGRPLSLRCTALADGAATAVVPTPTAKPVERAIPIRTPTQPPKPTPVQPGVRRSSFPPGFLFGSSTSSLQVEGAANEGGRLPSIWDTFAVEHPEKISDKSTPDVACDSYHKYKVGMGIQKSFGVIMLNVTSASHFSVPSVKNLDDVKLIKEAGMDVYRFSISWPRILPKGSLAGGLNKAGIRYYNNLINELLKNGITPFVTIFHWDVPQALEDEYGGFRDKRIVEDLTDFAEMCFRLFGDRVKHWITENEPYMLAVMGYDNGAGAPGRCSPSLGCAAGDSATEPYVVAHNLILAHASIVKLYREEFQDVQKGKIGLTLNINWSIPYSQSKEDIDARDRALEFNIGWFLNPVVHGDYPFIMKVLVGERLPKFTEEETKLVKGSYDFVGVNYYFTTYAKGKPFTPNDIGISFTKDQFADQLMEKAGVHIGEMTRSQGFYSYPEGMKELLVYIKKNYKSPTIYITENGVPDDDNGLSFEDALDDKERIKYLNDHLTKVQEAIGLGVDVKGYYTWSLLDNWEWVSGYTKRFGVSYVDYQNEQKRYQKDSFKWFAKVLKT